MRDRQPTDGADGIESMFRVGLFGERIEIVSRTRIRPFYRGGEEVTCISVNKISLF